MAGYSCGPRPALLLKNKIRPAAPAPPVRGATTFFSRRLDWTLLFVGYLVSSIVGTLIFLWFRLPDFSCIFMLICFALIARWYVTNKGQKYWQLLWLLCPILIQGVLFYLAESELRRLILYFDFPGDIIPRSHYIVLVIDTFFTFGLVLFSGIFPLLTLKNRTALAPAVDSLEQQERNDLVTGTDCEWPASGERKKEIDVNPVRVGRIENKREEEAVVAFNWFGKHQNWTAGIVIILILAMSWLLLIFTRSGWLAFIMALINVVGVWMLWMKGRNFGVSALAMWPFVAAIAFSVWSLNLDGGEFGRGWDAFRGALFIYVTGSVITCMAIAIAPGGRHAPKAANINGTSRKKGCKGNAELPGGQKGHSFRTPV